MAATVDLVVVGAGVVGLAHAYVAARAGKKVVVIERDVRANGASIRNFGFITVTGQERGTSWQLARRTRDMWAEIAPAANIAVEHAGLYVTARSDEAIAVLEAFMATEMGEGCSMVTPEAFRQACGGLGGSQLMGALFSPHELRLESRQAIPRFAAYLQELEAKLRAEQPRHLENGVHLIAVQSADGSLVVGDSHHYDRSPDPFAPASAEDDILDEYERALGASAPRVIERWTGTYAVSGERTFIVDKPSDRVRLVIVTSGTGASTALGIAETVIAEMFDIWTGYRP